MIRGKGRDDKEAIRLHRTTDMLIVYNDETGGVETADAILDKMTYKMMQPEGDLNPSNVS